MARLYQSFEAVYRLLERPRGARLTVAVLLVIHTFLLTYSAYVHSPTLNEPAHLVAGLSHWKFGRFELYRVNPPLVRMIAALPVITVGYKEDWGGFIEGPGARPEIGMGEEFVAANGERSLFLFTIARWACIPFSWIGAIICYLWARDLYGRPASVMACGIWCFEPNILAHASLITPDAGATALGLAACYTFWRWLTRPTWLQAAITGVVLGLAELAKTTLVVFYPLWPLMWLIYRWPTRKTMFARDWLREAGMLALRMLIGLYVLNLGYGFEGSFTKLKSFQFVSSLLTGAAPNGSQSVQHTAVLSTVASHYDADNTKPSNRFAHTVLAEFPLPFPRNYILGIDTQQFDFEKYGNPSYLRGQSRQHGWWYYYLYAIAIKVPLGLWAIGIVAQVASGLRIRTKPGRRVALRDELIVLFPAVLIFAIVSSKTGFSEHLRYALPAFPFAFIVGSKATTVCRLARLPIQDNVRNVRLLATHARFLPIVASALFCWFIASSLFVYPHSLSYFNELIGGPLNGHKHLLGSNLDWGQDLRYVIWLWKQANSSEYFHVAYYGFYQPVDVGLYDAYPWPATRYSNGNLITGEPPIPTSGKYVISVNAVYGYPWVFHKGRRLLDSQMYDMLQHTRPVARCGYSIWLFSSEDVMKSATMHAE